MKRYLLMLLTVLIGLNAYAQEDEKPARQIVGKFIQPEYTSRAKGIVYVEVLIDKDGNVMEAHAGSLGTTIEDYSLWKSAEIAALQTRFNAIEDEAPQWSTIAYHFGNSYNTDDVTTINIPEAKTVTPVKPTVSETKPQPKGTKIQRNFYGMTFGQPIDKRIIAQRFNISESAINIKEKTDHKITYQISNANRTFAMRTWKTVMIETYDGLFYSIIFKNNYNYRDSDRQGNDYTTLKDIFNQKYSSIRDWPGCCNDYYIKKNIWKDKKSLIELDFYRNPDESYITLIYKSTSMEEDLIRNVFDEI